MQEYTTTELFEKLGLRPKYGQRPTVPRAMKVALTEVTGIESRVTRRGKEVVRLWMGEDELWEDFFKYWGDQIPAGYRRSNQL